MSRSGAAGTALGAILSASLLALFILPIVALATYASPSDYLSVLQEPAARLSILFTLYASGIAVAICLSLGVPLGYLLARRRFPGKPLVEAAVGLPVVVPHLVAGFALLLLLSPGGLLGGLLPTLGLPVIDSLSAVVLVMVFVSAPYTVLGSTLAFQAVDERLVEAARGLGATPAEAFATVTFPIALRGIVAGGLLSWARSVSEIGGFLILAYAVYPGPGYPGPVTAPISIFIFGEFETNLRAAAATSAVFVLIAFVLFLAVRALERSGRLPWRPGGILP